MGYIHFFDDWQLISYHNLERRIGKPRYVPEATLEDKFCEGTYNFPCVARLDNGKYVALYVAAIPCERDPDFNVFNIPEGLFKDSKARVPVFCYAESNDGINWVKPDLSSILKGTGKRYLPNQVVDAGDGGPAYYDIHDPDPAQRFKLVLNPNPFGGHRVLMVSPDGVNWKKGPDISSQPSTDTPTSIFYNHLAKHYTFNIRNELGDRRVFFSDTEDFKSFSAPELIMHPCPLDPPLCGFYAMPVFAYENIFIGLLWQIRCDPSSHCLPNGSIDIVLCYSHDGKHFNRTGIRPFIERNELGEHGGGCLYTSSLLVDEQNNIRFYSGASKAEHFQNQELTDAALLMHKMRLDGFMYMATPTGKGFMRTRPIHIHGNDLRINARSPWGSIRVQVLDERARVIDGFSFDDCEALVGDELFWTPKWKGGSFGDLAGKIRRQLEFEIVTGEIYAIRGDFDVMTSLWVNDLTGTVDR